MFTFKELLTYSKLNLNANDILILHILKSIPPPVKLFNILNTYVCNIKERQLRNIVSNLENLNFFTRFRLKNGFIFAFPFIEKDDKKYKKFKQIKTGKVLPNINGKPLPVIKIKTNKPAIDCTSSYLYNIYNKYKRSFNVISKSINNNYILEEDFTLYNIMNKQSEHNVLNERNDNTLCNKTDSKRKLVVNKNNFLLIKAIKERFKTDFPDKNAYINNPIPKDFSYCLLKEKINQSTFLKEKTNLGLNWMLSNYNAIINDFYADKANNFSNKINNESSCDFNQRTYSKEFCESLFDPLNDV